jgi:hypothetical protein
MAYLSEDSEIYDLYAEAKKESNQWREDYHEFERLADNELLPDLDENLPETNDGSLAAGLFKLPKRIINNKLKGRATATDRDDAWITELANMQWENEIIPNANSQAPFHRKWKDAVRKSAIYGSVPLITLFVERGNYIGADFIVAQPQDVTLEPGKVSDYDSDIVFWDVYYTKLQLKDMIATAKRETKENKKADEEGYNKWDVKALEQILASNPTEDRSPRDDHTKKTDKAVDRGGIRFCIVFQRGVDSPFYMFHPSSKKKVREWTNPDPTGDIPVHFLYCYQDFINPYGVGIVKLAGGTQNVLDYMRQADVLATQLGFRPPVSIKGDMSETDLDSLIYAQDQQWIVGLAEVQREEISNQIYSQLPSRVSMYKTSLNQLLPIGDTSISGDTGDPQYSKTPAGVEFQKNQLSIDDEDYKDNVDMTFEAVAKSMINTHFANKQGEDLMKLKDEEVELLSKSGIEFPVDEEGEPSQELEIVWDEARAKFDFVMDADQDKASSDEKRLEGLLKVAEFRMADPMFDQKLQMSGKRINDGELYGEIISLTTDNDKILEDISPEDQEAMAQEEQMMAEQQAMQEQGQAPEQGQPQPEQMPQEGEMPDPQAMQNVQAVMQEYDVDEQTAAAMLEAERQGYDQEEILQAMQRNTQPQGGLDV